MFGSLSVPALVVVIGALALIAAYVIHWVLIVVGVVLIAVGVYLALGGQLGSL